MYQQKKVVLQRIVLGADLVLTVLSFLLAYQIKTTWFPGKLGVLYPLPNYFGLFFIVLPLWAFLLSRARIYEPSSTEYTFLWVLRLAKYLCYGFLILVLSLFVLRIQFVSRLLLFLFLIVNYLVLFFAHLLFRMIYAARTHKSRPRVFLVGYPEKIRFFLAKLAAERDVHIEISAIHFLEDAGQARHVPVSEPWIPQGTQIVADKKEIPHCMHEKIIDEIYFAIRPEDLTKVEEILAMAEEEGIDSRIIADMFDLKLSRASWDQLGSIPMITFSRSPAGQWQFFCKGVLDKSVAFFALVIASPLFLIIPLLVRRSSPGPVFFRQTRVGLRGRVFTMLKFRTMIQEAENLREELIGANELSGPVFKMQDDPRVTRMGKFLRRYSLDELPQLLNVLSGNMSLVGPRPALPEEVAQYQPWQRRRLSMRPGITGLWQVSGRDQRDFNAWVLLDLDYIDRWSLSLDLRIFCKTLPQVLMGKGV